MLNNSLVGGDAPGAANIATTGGGIFRESGTVTLNAGTAVCGNVPDQCVGFADPTHCLAMCPPQDIWRVGEAPEWCVRRWLRACPCPCGRVNQRRRW